MITLFLIFFFLTPVQAADGPAVKEPNVAGAFYPANAQELSAQIDGFMAQAGNVPDGRKVTIAFAPHAGYVYSGPVAAYTYKALAKNKYSTIIILAPSHYFPFEGAAIWPKGAFRTPLGVVPVDEEFSAALLAATPVVKELPQVFEREHSLEVQLPFVQKTFGPVKIVPLLLGEPDIKMCEHLAVALDKLIGGRDDVLVLVSSDMSHYFPYATANAMDAQALEAIQHEDIEGFWNGMVSRKIEMCGFVPATVGLMLARLRGLSTAEVLKYANSGDITGDKAKVVGYGAVILYKPVMAGLTADEKKYLSDLARRTVATFVKTGKKLEANASDPRLAQVQGAFVTITKKGQLRGCIGHIIGQEPLALTVRDVAIAAASQDPRFPPLAAGELKDIEVEVSVLSVPQPVKDAAAIVLGRDGVIVSDGAGHEGVFLPQVATETGWGKEQFLSELCSQKAGLAPDCWKTGSALYTFTAEVFQ